jgi:hypothetical protein
MGTTSDLTTPALTGDAHPARQVSGVLQRACACGRSTGGASCESCQEHGGAGMLQRRSDTRGTTPSSVPPSVVNVLASSGERLDAATQHSMGSRLRQDFSRVRVHTDAAAASSARAVGAMAYTVGQDVVFDHGRYAPGTAEGRKLLAHELAHVAQQAAHPESGPLRIGQPGSAHEQEADRVADGLDGPLTPAPAVIARQNALEAPLSWEEMFRTLSNTRAFSLTRPGEANNPAVDPERVGRGVGPDRTLRGREVFAVIQVVDRDGRRVSTGGGAHAIWGRGHAEEQAVAGVAREIPAGRDVRGGRMMVLVDQFPCGPDRHDCGTQLRDFARSRGLELEVRVPLRERVNEPGVSASPRTASRGAFRTDLAADPRTRVQLVTVDRLPGPGGGASGGSTPAPPPAPPGGRPAPSPSPSAPAPTGVGGLPEVSLSAPTRPASPATVIARQQVIAQLEQETAASVRMAGLVRGAVAVFGAVMQVMSALNTLDTAQRLSREGTMLGDAQRQAERLQQQGSNARTQAEQAAAASNMVGATLVVGDALARNDTDDLFTLSEALGDVSAGFGEPAERLSSFWREVDARSRAARVMADFYRQAIRLSIDDAAQAEAFSMWESCDRLSNTLGSAADSFRQAAETMQATAQWSGGLASAANRGAWRLVLGRIATAQQQLEAERRRRAATAPPPAAAPTPAPTNAHATPPGVHLPPPRPTGFPSEAEQQGTVCPNCHRPAGEGSRRSPLEGFTFGSGPGGQMTDDDLRRIREFAGGGR